MKRKHKRRLLAFLKHLHKTGALSCPPEDLVAAVDRLSRKSDAPRPQA